MPKTETGAISRREALLRGGAFVGAAVSAGREGGAEAGQSPAPGAAPELCFKSAVELSQLIRTRELTAREVLEAHLRQIERVNPKVNAVVTLVADEARAQADRADAALRGGGVAGPLHGLPIVVKDLVETKGIRTTFGSRIYKDHVPERDELLVERLRAAGAIILGKSNTPEFGAGSQTFNEVFGETKNPWDLTKTCGGSSGGGAVALACGMVPIADGSDMGGSLRNPPSFCNVVGLRPSPGRVPDWPSSLPWQTLSVSGPMGRSAADVALLLSALAGPDPRSPIALEEPGEIFRRLDVARAEAKRAVLHERVRVFMERYEFLVLPVSQVAPFPVEVRWVKEVAGVPMLTYIDWMASCYCITLTGLPAASVPAGFTPEGLPVGLQIVGRHHHDFEVLRLAHAFEAATAFGRRRPALAA